MNCSENIDPIAIWQEYEYLEHDFLKCTRYLPLIPENYNVWSPHFSDIILRIGSVFDSFLKRALFCVELDEVDGINEIRDKYAENKINMADYRTVFKPLYQLPSKKVFNLFTFESLSPFSSWANESSSLGWWRAYTNLKHDRFMNKEVATLEATLNALGSLFLVIILHSETAPVLVDYNIIHSNYSKESVKSIVSGIAQWNGMEPIYAKTNLFGFVFELETRKLDDEHKKHLLSLSYSG